MAKQQSNDAIRVNAKEYYDAACLFIQAGKNLLVAGGPGVGKTEITKQAAIACNMPIIMFHPVISDPTDLKGMPAIIPCNEERTKYIARFVPFESLRRLIDASENTVAFADDLGQAPPMVQAAWMQLLLERKLDEKIVSDKITFISATNRKQDKAGVQGILEPVKSRFVSILELYADADIWLNWARRPESGIHPYVRAFTRFKPGHITAWEPTNDMTNSPNPRTIKHVSDVMHMNPPNYLRPALIAGAAGAAYSAEFEAFIKVVRELPKMSAIAQYPKKCPVPNNESSKYAVVESLLDKISLKFADPFFTYIGRFPKEFQGWFYHQVKDLHPDVIKTKAVVDWAVKHGIE